MKLGQAKKKCREEGACNCGLEDEESLRESDCGLMERVFELRMTISESEDARELTEIKGALQRDYGNELAELGLSF
jgi:hypothetical protein